MSRMPNGRNQVQDEDARIREQSIRLAGDLTRWLDATQRDNENLRQVIVLASRAFGPGASFTQTELAAAMRAAGLPPETGAENSDLAFACTAFADAAEMFNVRRMPAAVTFLDRADDWIPREHRAENRTT